MKHKNKIFIIILILAFSNLSQAECIVKNSNGSKTAPQADFLYQLLKMTDTCPQNVQTFKTLLEKHENQVNTAMVANRGIQNPTFGSFSFFEEVKNNFNVQRGEFFFGHFTNAVNGVIHLDQTPAQQKLLIEVIAWDPQKKLFNFYELIGTTNGANWFYRGDSADILKDNENLYLGATTKPATLRCSACHTSGGPIMKEFSAPHNDWWSSTRPLIFGNNKLSIDVSSAVSKLIDAKDFSESVQIGINKLESSESYQKLKATQSLQEKLRPLFCETEINLESDLSPLATSVQMIQIPSASIINPILGQGVLSLQKTDYNQLLSLFKMNFPETSLADADHAWLVPVKGYSDQIAIQSLIANNVVTEEFALDVLATDMQNPLLSQKRCGLLKLVPNSGNMDDFIKALSQSKLSEARELFDNLTDNEKNKSYHLQSAQNILEQIKLDLQTSEGRVQLFKKLLQQRNSVFHSEISKNPMGQILEPGFRVIFPISRLNQ